MNQPSRLILPPGVRPTADQLSTVHPWDRPGFDPATLDAEDTRAYWARRQSEIVTATTVSEEVFLTAQAAERIRNNRNFTRIRSGMGPAPRLPKDGEAAAPAGQAGLQLLDASGLGGRSDARLLVLDETAAIDPALFAQLKAEKLVRGMEIIAVDELGTIDPSAWDAARLAGGGPVLGDDGHLRVVLDPEPQAATVEQILAMEPEEGEMSDREVLQSLRAKGAAVKIKGKSPAPVVTRSPVFNPIDALREQHRLYDATRMNPLAHGVKTGIVCMKTNMDPPHSLPAGFEGPRA